MGELVKSRSGDVVDAFRDAAANPDADLASAALLIARVEYPELDTARYLALLDFLGAEAHRRLAAAAPLADTPPHVEPALYAKVAALNEFLFDEMGFVGNETDYEDPRNSFLNEVLDRRTGIPITLSVVYMEVARRAGLAVLSRTFPAAVPDRARAALWRGSDHRSVPPRRHSPEGS